MTRGFAGILPRAAALLMFCGLAGNALAQTDPEACFVKGDNRRLSYEVVEVAPPPVASGDRELLASSPYYPGTIYQSKSLDPLPETPAGRAIKKYFLLWVNRCIYMQGVTPDAESCRNMRASKGNDSYVALPHSDLATRTALTDIRPAFSTYDKANACTLIQASQVMNGALTSFETHEAERIGLTLWNGSDLSALADMARDVTVGDGQTVKYLVDVCIAPTKGAVPDLKGLYLDYEVADGRSAQETVAFLTDLSRLVKKAGLKLGLASDPIASANLKIPLFHVSPHGIDWTDARQIVEIVDSYTPVLSTGAGKGNQYSMALARERTMTPFESYQRTLAIITQNGALPLTRELKSKIVWGVGLYDTSLAEAAQLHDEFKKEGYQGVAIIRNFVPQGGSCSRPENQVIACLTMGACDGHFGEDR